jgi:ribosomal protein S19E (S16A)
LALKSSGNKLKVKAEAILEKQRENPQYVLTNKERKTLKDWNLKQLNDRKKEVEQNTREVRKQNDSLKKRRKVKTTIPKSTQQTIPYVADYIEGMFEVTPNKFSKVYLIDDINYRTGKKEEQEYIFQKLVEFLNYFSDDVRFSFCIDNRIISKEEYERKVFCQMEGDTYDTHREEMNNVLRTQMIAGRNDMQIHKFITVTIDADTPIEALLRFHKLDAEIITNLRRIGANGRYLETEERLEYYHDKLRKGSEGEFQIDYDFIMKQGLSTKDYIAPSFIHFQNKYFQIEDEYYCGMFLNNLPAGLPDDFLYDMCDNEFPVTTTLAIEAVAQDKGLMIVKRQLTGIEMNKIDAEKKAIRAGYSPETIQHSIKDALRGAEEIYDDMMNKNQKMFFVTILFLVHGSTLEELNENCKILKSKARKYTTQLQELRFQQEEAFKVTLPFGYPPKDLSVERTLTSESTAIFMPFANQELFQPTGFYYGMNPMSHNLVIVDRKKMKTPSGFILGTSGSGKSFAVKREMLNVILRDSKANVLVIDPENEYGGFCRIMGGIVLKISSDSDCYINPMDMLEDYGLTEDDDSNTTPMEVKKEKAIRKKTEYIMSIVERMISVNGSADGSTITPQQRSLIDKCVKETYTEYLKHDFDPAYMPTLLDLQEVLNSKKSESEDAEKVAEGIEYYTTGSMNVFSHHTNININNRFVVFNVRDLGEQLKQVALIIVFDFIWNRMVENKFKGIRTYCYCDEIHVMFQSYYAAEQLKQLYKRGRKYGRATRF